MREGHLWEMMGDRWSCLASGSESGCEDDDESDEVMANPYLKEFKSTVPGVHGYVKCVAQSNCLPLLFVLTDSVLFFPDDVAWFAGSGSGRSS